MSKTLSQELVYKKAGTFILIPYVNNVPTKANQYIEAGTVETIQKTENLDTIEMNDGNSNDPAHIYVTKDNTGYDINMNTFSPQLNAMLHGHTYLTGTDADANIEVVLEHTIDSNAYDLTDTPPTTIDNVLQLYVSDKKGNVFTSTATTASTGQYVFDTTAKTITFSTTDAGTEVLIDVIYEGTDVVEIQAADTPSLPKFQAVIVGEIVAADEGVTYNTVSTLDKVVVVSTTQPNQSNQHQGAWSFTLRSLKPRAGHKAHDFKIVAKA